MWKCVISCFTATMLLGAAPHQRKDDAQPGSGVLCLWAFASVANEVTKQCHPEASAAVRREFEEAVTRLHAYAVRNGLSEANAALFERTQGGAGRGAALCEGDIARTYDAMLGGAERGELRKGVDELTAKDGPPAWGDCV